MIIRTVDGVPFYAKYLLRAEVEDDSAPFRINGDGLYCFTDTELARAEAYLQEKGVKYKIEKLPAPENWNRTEGVKYGSLEEVQAHVKQGVEPESLTIPRLMERVQAAEEKARVAEAKARAAEERATELEVLEERLLAVERFEARLKDLEGAVMGSKTEG